MSKKIEALKLALECIEAWDRGCDRDHYWRDIEAATTAVKEALADSALERMAQNERELGIQMEPPCKTGSQCTSKCQQCEQPAQQQEPVAYAVYHRMGGSKSLHWPEQHSEDGDHNEYRLVPLYTAPPASKPLTDEQIEALPLPPSGTATVRDLVRIIEAAHGITGETK